MDTPFSVKNKQTPCEMTNKCSVTLSSLSLLSASFLPVVYGVVKLSCGLMLVPEKRRGSGFDPGTNSNNSQNNHEHKTCDQEVGYQNFSSFILVANLLETGVLGNDSKRVLR